MAAVACNGESSVSSVWTTRWLIRRAASPAGQSPLSRVYACRESCSSLSLQSFRATIGTLDLCHNSFISSKLLFTPLIFHCTRFSVSIFTNLFGLAWETSLGRAPAGLELLCPRPSSPPLWGRSGNGQEKAEDDPRGLDPR